MNEIVLEQLADILGPGRRSVYADEQQIVIEPGEGRLTFDQLGRLAVLFQTEKIDLDYDAGHADWSDVTPGDPSSFYIRIYESPLRSLFTTPWVIQGR